MVLQRKETRGKRKKMKPGVFWSFRICLMSPGVFLSIHVIIKLISDVTLINWIEGPILKLLNFVRVIYEN